MGIDSIASCKKPSKWAYEKLKVPKSYQQELMEKWNKKELFSINLEIIDMSLKSVWKIKIAKYVSFQYRMIHCAILLNDRLYHLSIMPSQTCINCSNAKETYKHFFFICPAAKDILLKILHKFNVEMNTVNFCDVIFGSQDCSWLNTLLIVYKQNMYAAKCLKQKPQGHKIIAEILFIKEIELQKCFSNKKRKQLESKWNNNKNDVDTTQNTQDYILHYITNI